MGMYNYLNFQDLCPHCKENLQFQAEIKIAFLNLDSYCVGDKLNWKNKAHKASDIYAGYVECDNCAKDFWIDVIVKEDIISAIKISKKEGYIK
ncbi:MAG: hypothetical protein LBV04_03510 [Deferribacteraceae bacterium]|jgi:hypothetical protein|nr:hypothetical protein [Deferribacteraceae bacterium]